MHKLFFEDILLSKGGGLMGYASDMERCLDYIEKHIDEDISATELAKMLGYSFYHFCHVFKSIVGMSAGAYLRKRRLELAAGDLLNGETVTNAAIRRGYDTPSGFTRAFTRTYGISPLDYKKKGGTKRMKVEFKEFGPCIAVGYSLAPPEGEVDVRDNGAYWKGKDFSLVSEEDYAKLCNPNRGEIGAWMHPDGKTGDLHYFFGPVTTDKSFIPNGMIPLDIPKGEYAVFSVTKAESAQELAENVKKAWEYIFKDWFDNSEYKFNAGAIDFEYYMGEETYIYIPVVKK